MTRGLKDDSFFQKIEPKGADHLKQKKKRKKEKKRETINSCCKEKLCSNLKNDTI